MSQCTPSTTIIKKIKLFCFQEHYKESEKITSKWDKICASHIADMIANRNPESIKNTNNSK
jgi:hypothetical protein